MGWIDASAAVNLASGLAGQLGPVGDPVDQPRLLQARELQALSLGWHIILVCFGVTFPVLVVFAEGLWLRTGDPVYRELARRWSKVMAVLFAVGAVSGTILSFELGILWPEFMAQFGDVFGLAFGLEGFAFFTEAIFIGIYVYGWDRLPARVHVLTGLPMIIAGHAGAFFIIAVNAWMNHPVGFDVVGGEVTNVRPWAALFSAAVWPALVHMLIAAYVTAGFLAASVYAWAWLKGDRSRRVRTAFIIPFTLAALAAPAQLFVGDWVARFAAEEQPIKLAAQEGLVQSEKGAPFTIGGYFQDGEMKGGIEIPYLLSLLAFHDPDAEVVGLDSVPPDDRPPVNINHFAFQIMIGVGTLLALLSVVFLVTWWWRRRLPQSVWFYRAAVVAGPAAAAALLSGWIVTEVGRQPWIVYEVMRTDAAVTAAGSVNFWFPAFAAIYLALTVGAIWALRRFASQNREADAGAAEGGP